MAQKMMDWKITLDQLLDQIREEMRGSVDKYFDSLQKNISAYPFGGTELGDKIKNSARRNITIARNHAHKLCQAKDFLEVVPIQTEFIQSQLCSFGEEIKSFGEAYAKMAKEMLDAPLRKLD
jgi:hypothetical protein